MCEEPLKTFDWTFSCRLCLNIGEHEIFGGSLPLKITKHLNLLVYEGDPMPKRLCSICKSQLDEWEAFSARCIATDESLRRKLELEPFKTLDVVKDFLSKSKSNENGKKEMFLDDVDDGDIAVVDEKENHVGEAVAEAVAFIPNLNLVVKQEPEDTFGDPPEIDPGGPTPSITSITGNSENGGSINNKVSTFIDTQSSSPLVSSVGNAGTEHDSSCHDQNNVQVEGNRMSSNAGTIESDIQNGIGPGIILSVKGNAGEKWSNGSASLNEINIKEEPRSPEELDHDKSYNLRPRAEPYFEEPIHDDTGVHSGITPWKCHVCLLYFASNEKLKIHTFGPDCIGWNMEHFDCRVCSKRFYSEIDLAEHNLNSKHLKIMHQVMCDELRSCSKCDKSFIDVNRLREHAKMHLIKKEKAKSPASQNSCNKCEVVFMNKADLDQHLSAECHPASETSANTTRAIHIPSVEKSPVTPKEQKENICVLCPTVRFKSEDSYYDHRFAMHGIPDERVSCRMCSEKFRTTAALAEHIQVHTKAVARKSTQAPIPPLPEMKPVSGGAIRCRRCGALFESAELLTRHELLKHKNATPYWCRKCRCRFATRSLLLIHHRTHGGGDTVEETSEPSNVSVSTPKVVEMSAPSSQEELLCRQCNILFNCESDFKRHENCHQLNFQGKVRNVPNGLVLNFQCSQCPQLFHSKKSIGRHSYIRHGGQPITFLPLNVPIPPLVKPPEKGQSQKTRLNLECQVCSAKFTTQASMNFHFKKVHSSTIKEEVMDPPIMECDEPVSSSFDLFQPGSSQLTPPPNTVNCPFCSKFIASSYISKHIRFQHMERKRGSKDLLGYKTHRMRKKTFQCNFCPKMCCSQSNLQRHEASHNMFQHNYLCLCGQEFPYVKHWEYVAHQELCRKTKNNGQGKETITQSPVSSNLTATLPPARMAATPPLLLKKEEEKKRVEWTCQHCHKTYETQSLLDLHVMTAHVYEELTIVKVEKPLELWRVTENKIVREVGSGVLCCTLCGIRFDNTDSATYHRSLHPRGNLYVVQIGDSLYQCTICDKVLSQRHAALEHATHHVQSNMRPTASVSTGIGLHFF